MTAQPVAVVVGLDTVVGLQTARVLHRRGVPVVGIASDPRHYCARTRAATRVVAAPTAGEGLIDTLEVLADDLPDHPVLYPCRDPSVVTVSAHRDRLDRYRLALPEHAVIEDLTDKGRFAALAARLGVRVPVTRVVSHGDELVEAADAVGFPCVLKPVFRDDTWQDHSPAKAFLAADPAALRQVFAQVGSLACRFVLQEWVPGPATAQLTCNALFGEHGEPLATFVSRKVRQWPPGTGEGSMGVAWPDDEMRALTVELFSRVGLRGLGYLEAKRDPRDGGLVVIEPNVGRPTGRSALADAAGVELLYGMYCDLTGRSLPSFGAQLPTDLRWVFLRTDLQAGARQWRRGEIGLGAWLRSYRGPKVDAVISARDPLPALADVVRSARRLVRRPAPQGRRP